MTISDEPCGRVRVTNDFVVAVGVLRNWRVVCIRAEPEALTKKTATLIHWRASLFALALLSAYPSSGAAQDPASEPRGFIREPAAIERAAVFADRRQGNGELTNGYYIDFLNMIPGAGWISGGPGYRHW